ncbi:MAG: hypothetical protein ACI358_06450 [Candidatus Limimorpha sp.]
MENAANSLNIEIRAKHSSDKDAITQDIIEKCIAIAVKAHEGQRDIDGNAVILHPLIVGSMGLTDAEKCVGFLHDTIEDTDLTLEDLRKQNIPEEIIEALDLCTHDKDMEYYQYVQRIIESGNETAIHVKYNDLKHNLARGKAFKYPRLVEKHSMAIKMIEDYLNKK